MKIAGNITYSSISLVSSGHIVFPQYNLILTNCKKSFLNIGQFINNPRLIPLENNNNNQNNQINIENEINQNNININETGDLFFNGNFETKITQAHNDILNLINEERKKMKDSQDTIEKLREKYINYKRKELEKLDKEKNELKYLI